MNVREIRTKLLMTQQELAKELNVSYITIQRWELGKSAISFKHQRKILEFCKQHNIEV